MSLLLPPSLLPVAFAPVPYSPEVLAATPYTAIQLTFHAGGSYDPDGDSIRLKALHPNLWPKRVKRSPKDGTVQSRMEGIDAHELHFYGYNQHLVWATTERDHLFKLLGVPKENPPPGGVPGWALTRSSDLYGRCVTFLFPQGVSLKDGAKYMTGDASFLDLIKQSANYQMLSDGMAYPMFYEYLPLPLLRLMQEEVRKARTEKKGFWPEDKTLEGARFLTTDDAEEIPFLPKVFRRMVRYFDSLPDGTKGLQGLRQYLEREPDMLHLASEILADGRPKRVLGFHDPEIMEIDEKTNRLRLLVPPEEFVFHERSGPNPILPNKH